MMVQRKRWPMEKPRIAVFGGQRGKTFLDHTSACGKGELVAVCDRDEEVLQDVRAYCEARGAAPLLVREFDGLFAAKPSCVVLANYANEHAPYAVRCLDKKVAVISEVLPAQNLREAAELCDAVERSKAAYLYAENYCFMEGPREMRRLYRKGLLGEFEYGEGEYLHNCEPIWHQLTYGQRDHWRNLQYAPFYCTHSLGPIVHATGLRPVRVVGFEPPYNRKMARMGALSAPYSVEMVTLENGAVVRSLHGQLTKNSVWFSMYGSLGHIEAVREAAVLGGGKRQGTLYASLDLKEGEPCDEVDEYVPKNAFPDAPQGGHALSDRYMIENFLDVLSGGEGDAIGVYEAMDMFLPGIFAYKSVLAGGVPMEVPDFRLRSERDKWRDDTSCTDPAAAGDQLLPANAKGNPVIEQSVYDGLYEKWKRERDKEENK